MFKGKKKRERNTLHCQSIPLLLHIVCMSHFQNHTSFDCWRRKKEEGLRASGRKGVAHLSGFLKSHKTTQHFSTIIHRDRQRKKGKKTVTAIPRGKHHFSSDQWSEACSGLVSTRVGDNLGTPGVVISFHLFAPFFHLFLHHSFFLNHNSSEFRLLTLKNTLVNGFFSVFLFSLHWLIAKLQDNFGEQH